MLRRDHDNRLVVDIRNMSEMIDVRKKMASFFSAFADERRMSRRAAAERFGIPLPKVQAIMDPDGNEGRGYSVEKLLQIADNMNLQARITIADKGASVRPALQDQVWRTEGQRMCAELLDWHMSTPSWKKSLGVWVSSNQLERQRQYARIEDDLQALSLLTLDECLSSITSAALGAMLDNGGRTDASRVAHERLIELREQVKAFSDEYILLSEAIDVIFECQNLLIEEPGKLI